MDFSYGLLIRGLLLSLVLMPGIAAAQVRARLPSGTQPPPLTDSPPPATSAPVGASLGTGISGNTSLSPLVPSGTVGASLGQPAFDPYAPQTTPSLGSTLFGGAPAAPNYSYPGAGTGYAAPGGVPPALPPSAYGTPAIGGTPLGTPAYGAPGYAAPGYGAGAYPTTPPALFPNGFTGPNALWSEGTIIGAPVRLIQGPRVRHAWLAGTKGRELGIHETDVSVALTYPNFLFSDRPIYVVPSFSLYLFDGPRPENFDGAMPDLPGQTYGAFIDSLWQPDINGIVGFDLGARVGVFSDFDTLNKNSLRTLGQGLVRLRLTPTMTLKGGAIYVDRADIKLIPAGGILWEPNPQARFDLYFPQPKVSQYVTTIGNQDLWWYIGGEFGGGTWTIERAVDGGSDKVDVNDIRVLVGMEFGPPEWFREGRRLGFIEAGWVTERRLIYVRRPEDNVHLKDTFMLRAGIGY